MHLLLIKPNKDADAVEPSNKINQQGADLAIRKTYPGESGALANKEDSDPSVRLVEVRDPIQQPDAADIEAVEAAAKNACFLEDQEHQRLHNILVLVLIAEQVQAASRVYV